MIDNKKTEEIKRRTSIALANYSTNTITAETKYRGYKFEPAFNGEPSREFVSYEELYEIHMKTKAIKNGLLIIDEPDAEDIYEVLGMSNWRETIVTEEDIDKMATDSSIENQKKIIAIKDISVMERLRTRHIYLVNQKDERVSYVIGSLINDRYKELINNKPYSSLQVNEPETTNVNNKEMELIKAELEEQRKVNAEMMAMIKSFMSNNAEQVKNTVANKPKKSTTTKRNTNKK